MWRIKSFFNSIKNLIIYFPIIWKDRDWDYAYTTELLIFKLKKQANFINKYKRYKSWERDVQRINTVVSLLQKDLDEFYALEYFDYYQVDVTFDSGSMKTKLLNDNSAEFYAKHKSTWKRIIKTLDDPDHTSTLCFMIAVDRHNKCHELAWELIKRNIQRWWD